MEFVLIAAIALCASLIAGTLGLGGAVLLIPAYLYLPSLFGVMPLDAKSISGITSIQVLGTSLFGALLHRRKGAVSRRLTLTIGIPITLSSLSGALFSGSVNSEVIIAVFAVMAVVGAALILLRVEEPEEIPVDALQFSVPRALAIAVGVGFFGGMVGAPGAFLLSPLLLTFLRIPTRITIGTTLGIVILSAFAASVGKGVTGQVPVLHTITALVASIPGVTLGSILSHRLHTRILRRTLAVVIALIGLQMIWRVLF